MLLQTVLQGQTINRSFYALGTLLKEIILHATNRLLSVMNKLNDA